MSGSAEINSVPATGAQINTDDPLLEGFKEDDKLPTFFEEPAEEPETETEEPEVTEESEEESDEDATEDDTEDEDASEESPEDTDEESEEEEDTETPETLATLLGLVNDLRSEISELKAGTKPDEQEQADPAAAIQPIQPKEIAVELSDDDFDELSSSKEGAQKVLNQVANQAISSALSQAHETLLQDLIRVNQYTQAKWNVVQKAVDKWEAANPDLVVLRDKNPQIVGQMLIDEGNRVQAANPKLPPLEVFNRAGKNVRSMLEELQAKADDTGDKKKPADKKPKPKGGGAKPPPKPKSKLSAAEEELLADLRPGFT